MGRDTGVDRVGNPPGEYIFLGARNWRGIQGNVDEQMSWLGYLCTRVVRKRKECRRILLLLHGERKE